MVLYEPQDVVNIAAAIRAMKNMGVLHLRLVRAVELDPTLIELVAHDTRDVMERVSRFDTLDEALADCVMVAAFTARRRAAKRRVSSPRSIAGEVLGRAAGGPVALLFGREDSGLPNDALDRAHVAVTIPTSEHSSLNLAQAVLVALYELHLAAPGSFAPARAAAQGRPSRHGGELRGPLRGRRAGAGGAGFLPDQESRAHPAYGSLTRLSRGARLPGDPAHPRHGAGSRPRARSRTLTPLTLGRAAVFFVECRFLSSPLRPPRPPGALARPR